MRSSDGSVLLIIASIFLLVGIVLIYINVTSFGRKKKINKNKSVLVLQLIVFFKVALLIIATLIIITSLILGTFGFYQTKEHNLVISLNELDKSHYELIETDNNSNEYFENKGNLNPGGILGVLIEPIVPSDVEVYEIIIINDNNKEETIKITSVNTEVIESNDVEPNVEISYDGHYELTVPIK